MTFGRDVFAAPGIPMPIEGTLTVTPPSTLGEAISRQARAEGNPGHRANACPRPFVYRQMLREQDGSALARDQEATQEALDTLGRWQPEQWATPEGRPPSDLRGQHPPSMTDVF